MHVNAEQWKKSKWQKRELWTGYLQISGPNPFFFLFEVGIESVAETNVEEVQSRPGRLKIWRSVPQDYNDKLDEKA